MFAVENRLNTNTGVLDLPAASSFVAIERPIEFRVPDKADSNVRVRLSKTLGQINGKFDREKFLLPISINF